MNFPARLTHPEHGAMHAYSQAEVEKLQKRGWEPEQQEPPPAKRGRPKKEKA